MNTDLKEFMARTIGSREMWIGTTVAPDDNVALIVRTVKTVREGK